MKGSAAPSQSHDVPSRLPQPLARQDAVDPQAIARYTNVGFLPLFQRFPLTEQTKLTVLAEMMSLSTAKASAIVESLSSEVNANVADLLSDTNVIEALPLLPFQHGARVIAVGDSITVDRIGWAEMMSLLAEQIPQPRFTVVNLGVGGQTSSDVISQMDVYADWQPDWVILMIGTNDFRFHTEQMDSTMLSKSETTRNLLLVRRLIKEDLGAQLVVVTPPPVAKPGVTVGSGVRAVGWGEGEDESLAEFIRSEFASHIDVHSVLSDGTAEDLFEEDGIHPNALGQKLILRTILLKLPSIGS